LKQHKGVQGYPFEIALHFRPPGWFLFLSLIGTFEGGTWALSRGYMVKTGQY
jgi:MFS-type transporter involved in bile tolerance (Atg22 family)